MKSDRRSRSRLDTTAALATCGSDPTTVRIFIASLRTSAGRHASEADRRGCPGGRVMSGNREDARQRSLDVAAATDQARRNSGHGTCAADLEGLAHDVSGVVAAKAQGPGR